MKIIVKNMNKSEILLSLSEKEKTVLALVLCGQSIKNTANCLKLSAKTIEWYRERLKIKFSVISLNELIIKLMQLPEYEFLVLYGRDFLLSHQRASRLSA